MAKILDILATVTAGSSHLEVLWKKIGATANIYAKEIILVKI